MHALPPWESALEPAARACAARLAGRSEPDLSDTLVLLPGVHAARALRARIRGLSARDALIGPACHSLATLSGTLAPARRAAGQRARLMLLEAVRAHPGLTGGFPPWTLVDALASLFEELDDRESGLPPDADALATALERAYGDGAPGRPLRREAALVSVLWNEWRDRGGRGTLGASAAALDALDAWRRHGGRHLIVAGLDDVPPALARRFAEAEADGWATVFVPGAGDGPPDAANALFDAALASGDAPLVARADALASAWPDAPGADAFATAAADGPEHEARIVDVRVREWWLEGHRRIALVTEDRKLARRVRALLDRAGLRLDDSGGWALSTTSAAAALERWLEAVEEDFRASPLLDLLKSPFCRFDADRDTHLSAVWQFEEGVVRHEQVARGLAAYRRAVEWRAERLPDAWGAGLAARLSEVLDRIEHAAAPLARHLRGTHAAADFAAALDESLARLGLRDGYAEDAAGRRVLEELAAMGRAAATGPRLEWPEWRAWLAGTLERAVFREPSGGHVALLSLADCAVGEFDAVVIAGADADHLPGRAAPHPFFNDAVRAQLGLETWAARRERDARRFRRALSLAPRRLVTWTREAAHAERLPSPWLAAIDAVHVRAWRTPPPAPAAVALARDDATLVVEPAGPTPPSRRPRPALDRLPSRWSAGAHQDIVDCPYRWFAARRLGLEAPEALREAMSKQDFGELVHRCLLAFHQGVRGLSGPFGKPVDAQNAADAAALLERLGDEVLAERAEHDFNARVWLRAWRRAIPRVVEFEVARARDGWRVTHAEHVFERQVGRVTLHGRIDRVETDGARTAVLDYKTGGAATVADIAAGEDVQLASYAAGLDGPAEIRYVALAEALKGDAVKLTGLPSARHADTDVAALVDEVVARLARITDALAAGAALPAWGDERACRWCRFDGVCRRGTWADDA